MEETSNTVENQTPDEHNAIDESVTDSQAHLESEDSATSELANQQQTEEEKRFTQAQVNSILKKEKEAARKKYEAQYQQQYAPQPPYTQNIAPEDPKQTDFMRQMQVYQHQQKVAQLINSEQRSMLEAANKYEDFNSVVLHDPTLPVTEHMQQALTLISDETNVADFWYNAAKNHRQELSRISSLPTVAQQQAAILRLEGRLSAGKQAKAPGAPQPMAIERNTSKGSFSSLSVDEAIIQEAKNHNQNRRR